MQKVDKFLYEHELCRIATSGKDCAPHVVPVSYIYYKKKIYISTDYATKKFKNILDNPQVAVVVDDVNPQMGLLLQGKARIIERGDEWCEIYSMFFKKFEWARKNPWKEGEAPFLEISIDKMVKWGFS
jgi:nitroimidazol reductase NimA-like FMN-containing flavoprotein (pyridoxamine 5'-phosphate oxidase superfamily)